MASIGYGVCLLLSIFVVILMIQKNYENANVYYWTIVVLLPVIILAYWLRTKATTPEAVKLSNCFSYLDSTILPTLMIFVMLHSLKVQVKPLIKTIAYALDFVFLVIVYLCTDNNLYYEKIDITYAGNGLGYSSKLIGGPLNTIHYVFLICMFIAIVVIIVMGFIKNGTYSRRSLVLFAVISGIGFILYMVEKIFSPKFPFLPYLYAVADVIVAIDYDYIHMHSLSGLISTHYDMEHEHGYAAISLSRTFLNCNDKCCEFIPLLKQKRIDEKLNEKEEYGKLFLELIDDFEAGRGNSAEFEAGDIICRCEISYFSVRKDISRQGYLIDIRDVTEEKHNLQILTDYNDLLNKEVAQKTENIAEIQRKIVLGMANMIENRDNNTGGHVKRTSDIIGIIVEEIKKQGHIKLDDQLAVDIVRAAPMHDLGKLHIDSAILCKPARLTDEEYAIMKTHSVKSGEMVMILLDGVEEEHFVKTSFNVARFHHERWDGKGYPEGLVGGMIPLEARIMAVADVYDALVSKRCYKEPMSFEKATAIMCEGMGTQFDPNMREVFLGCRDKLEAYYRKANAQ